jgi:prolipoprotein diacylglyceryl transferase
MPSSSYLYWNASPIIFTVGPVSLRWYGFLFASGFLAGLVIVKWMYRRDGRPMADADSLFNYVALGTIFGARLGHCLFYDPAYYLGHPLEILKIWKGGLASHGALIGILFAVYLFSRKRDDQPFWWVMDRLAIPTILAGSMIRLGNLFNSEIIGKPTDAPWAMIFARVDALPRHPTQLYESVAYAAIFIILMWLYRRYGARLADGRLSGAFLVMVFGFRFLVEVTKTRQAAFGHGFPLNMGQILSIPVVMVGLWLLFRKQETQRK